MKRLLCSLLSILSLMALCAGFAGAQAGKPILSAAPEPSSAPPPASMPAVGTTDPTYVIGPDDSIRVTVWEEAKFSGDMPVRPDGMITLPLAGDIRAEGRTPMQLATDITLQIKKFVIDPVVNVSVLAVNSKRVYMYGEVGRPGPMPISPGMTLLQAIDSAGGPTAYAKTKKIYILRTVAGKQQKIPFDYNKAMKTNDMQGVVLAPGDNIVVP